MSGKIVTSRTLLLMVAVFVRVTPEAQSAQRQRKPANLTDATIFSATSMLIQAGVRPTPQAVTTTARGLLENQQRSLRTAVDSKQIPIQKYHHQNKQVVAALSAVDARAQELVRRKRPTVIQRLGQIAELPFKVTGEIRRFVERPLPDELKPLARILVGQYVGRQFDTLTRHLIEKFGSGRDVARFVNAWNRIAPYKDNPELIGNQLKERLQELTRGELGKVFDRLLQSGLRKIGDNPAAREVFVSQLQMARQAVEKGAGDKIDKLIEQHKEELEKLSKDLTRPMPNKELRRRLAQIPKNLRRWMVQTIAEPPILDEPTTQEAVPLKAVFVASPDEGSPPLKVAFYAGASLGDVSSCAWRFGDQTSAGGESASHVYEKEGQFEVVLTVTGKDGKTDSTAQVIEVKSKPLPKLVVRSVTAQPAEVEPGGSVALSAEVAVSDCEQEGQVSYAFSPEGLGKVTGGTKADLGYDVECAGTLSIPENATPGPRRVLFEVSVILDMPGQAAGQAPKGGHPAGMVAKGQASFTVVAPKDKAAPTELPIEAWAGIWRYQPTSSKEVFRPSSELRVRIIDSKSLSVSDGYKDNVYRVSGNQAVTRGQESLQGLLRVNYTYTLTLSPDGRRMTCRWDSKSNNLSDPQPSKTGTRTYEYLKVSGSAPPKAGSSGSSGRK